MSTQVIHGYLAVCVCVVGVVCSCINMAVLTRPSMRSPLGLILTAVALTDLLECAMYGVLALYVYILNIEHELTDCYTPSTARVIQVAQILLKTCHSTNLWMTVSLAIIRFIFIFRRKLGTNSFSKRQARYTLVAVCVATILCCIPFSFRTDVVERQNITCGRACYIIEFSDFAQKHEAFRDFLFVFNAVFLRMLPCLLLAIFSVLLIVHVKRTDRQRASLMSGRHQTNINVKHHRTTTMLAAVIVCTFITEIPHSILTFLNVIDDTYLFIYIQFGEVLDIMSLISSVLNFTIYCTMSKKFRDIFKKIMCCPTGTFSPRSSVNTHSTTL